MNTNRRRGFTALGYYPPSCFIAARSRVREEEE